MTQIEIKQKKKITALSVVVAIMAMIIVGAAIAVGIIFGRKTGGTADAYMIEGTYQKAYYNLVDETNNMSVNLKKIDALTSESRQRELLYEVWSYSKSASDNLATLSIEGEGSIKLKKFINQLGDYSKYLAKKTPLKNEEKENLYRIGEMLNEVSLALKNIEPEGNQFYGDNGLINEVLPDMFDSFVKPSVEYPTLIYDGPFSDGIEERKSKITGKEITIDEGKDIIKKMFDLTENDEIKNPKEIKGDIDFYSYEVALSKDGTMVINLSKIGGKLLAVYKEATTANDAGYSDNELIEKATSILEHVGISDMEAVWIERIKGEAYITMAAKQNGIILYPDIIKVKLSLGDLTLRGIDSKLYAVNHKERSLNSAGISSSDIKVDIDVKNVKLALIPYGELSEKLCYEFYGTKGDGEYFVYVDANTGEELNILYVINSQQGRLLI